MEFINLAADNIIIGPNAFFIILEWIIPFKMYSAFNPTSQTDIIEWLPQAVHPKAWFIISCENYKGGDATVLCL